MILSTSVWRIFTILGIFNYSLESRFSKTDEIPFEIGKGVFRNLFIEDEINKKTKDRWGLCPPHPQAVSHFKITN